MKQLGISIWDKINHEVLLAKMNMNHLQPKEEDYRW